MSAVSPARMRMGRFMGASCGDWCCEACVHTPAWLFVPTPLVPESDCVEADDVAPDPLGTRSRRRDLVEIRWLGGGPVAGHRRAVHDALLARAVPGPAAMQRTAVVPHHQVADTPVMAIHVLGPDRHLEELGEQDPALVDPEALDPPGMGADVDVLPAIPRIGAHQGMPHGRIVAAHLRADAWVDQAAREAEAVDDDPAVDLPAEILRQRVVGHPHADELGLAALGRDDAGGERRRVRGHGLEGAVAVPELVAGLVEHPPIAPVHELAVLVHVREIYHVRAEPVFLAEGAHGGLEGPEALAERHLLLVGERL